MYSRSFRSSLFLCFKVSLSVKPFLWKWLLFAWKWNCMQNSFSYERIALRLVLIQRPKRTQKWSISSPLIIGEMFVPSLYRQNYLAAENPRDFRAFFIQREIPRRWSSTRFSYLLHTDRIISPLKIGEIFVPSLYRQNYLAAENRRDFLAFFIQTEIPRR